MAGNRPLRVGVLCSGRAPGLAQLLAASRRAAGYEVVACVTSSEAFPELRREAEAAGVPFVSNPIRTFYRWTGAPLRDLSVREDYDRGTLHILRGCRCDLVVLAGYLYRLTAPMLAAFPGHILNVHHADLTLRDAHGGPRYPGLRAVRSALFAGEPETRATLHVVTQELDAGPALLRSWPFPVSPLVAEGRRRGAIDMLKAYAFAHQQWVLLTAFGPLLARGLELWAAGRMFAREGAWEVDGRPAPVDLTPEGRLAPAWPLRPAAAVAV
ncbi:MAG TPA: formyltransferase family protein [Vicinamibacteria bacterium]|jgi:folate-dependent phosphoribosylglycinamide formyltransferase PurN